VSIIGRGGFGKVWKVFYKKKNKYFAMKEMSKTKIIDKKSDKSVKSERDLLSKMSHPFIVNMHFSFQDNENLYLVMDLLSGGDLRYHICKNRKFSEEQSKFFIACILLGLEYCHSNKIIHRDIKPENLVLDENGYVHITDFGIAKIQVENNRKETSGTPGYMSPEVLCAQDHTIAVDYFALGIMGYEFMKGVRPYLGKSRKEIKEKIMAKQAKISKKEIENGWSLESADCINRLLQRKPIKRLGLNGAKEVKEHIWFANYKWKELYNKRLESPFVPNGEDNFDFKYCNAVINPGVQTKERYAEIVASDNYKTLFLDYYNFNRYLLIENQNQYQYQQNFINPHEKIYKEDDNNIEHSRIKSFSNYNRLRNDKHNGLIGYNSQNVSHVRAVSASDGPNQAFFNANLYVNNRKKLKKTLSEFKNNNLNKINSKKLYNSNNIYMSKINKLNNNIINNNNNNNNNGSTNGTSDHSTNINSNKKVNVFK
jgi:serine/threonine protein kinase